MSVQLAKVTAEVHLLLNAELLSAKEDHETIDERIMHLLELLAERFGQGRDQKSRPRCLAWICAIQWLVAWGASLVEVVDARLLSVSNWRDWLLDGRLPQAFDPYRQPVARLRDRPHLPAWYVAIR